MKTPPVDPNRTILLLFLILMVLIAALSRSNLKIGPGGLEFNPTVQSSLQITRLQYSASCDFGERD